jgi:hypothetical protein
MVANMTKSCIRRDTGAPKIKKQVRWQPWTCSFRFIEMPDEAQLLATWYQEEDLQSFRKETQLVVDLVEQYGKRTVEMAGTVSTLGLARFGAEQTALRRDRQDRALDDILNEQEIQQKAGMCRPDKIALQIQGISIQSHTDARALAREFLKDSAAQHDDEVEASAAGEQRVGSSTTSLSVKKVTGKLSSIIANLRHTLVRTRYARG